MKYSLLFALSLAFFGLTSCDVEQTEEGEMPEMDVDVEEGNMPEYDVEWADVNVNKTTRTVYVPKVVMEKEEIEVPVIDFDMPDDMEGEKEERTLIVEAEVTGQQHELDIEEAYVKDNRILVIAELEREDTEIGEETMRVSDRIVVNAPDLDVKYYIVGDKPEGNFNTQHAYIGSKSEISDKLNGATQIY